MANPSGFFTVPGAGPRQIWTLGTTQNITYSTVFPSYTIALWQQYAGGGGANLGPVVLTKQASTPVQTSFLWTVQTYNLDLATNDEFLFWIFNGTDPAAQGILPAPSVSSAYFTILKEAESATTTTSKSATTSSKTASTSTTASTGAGTGTPLTTGGTSVPAATGAGSGTGGTNVVAVGVGVGVGVLALVALVGLVGWWWLWEKTTVLDGLKKKKPGPGTEPGGGGPVEMYSAPPADPDMNKGFMYPVGHELGPNHAVELSAAPGAVEMGTVHTAGWPRAELPSDGFIPRRTDTSNRVI